MNRVDLEIIDGDNLELNRIEESSSGESSSKLSDNCCGKVEVLLVDDHVFNLMPLETIIGD